MKNLILYENKRFWQSGKNIVILLALVALLLGMVVYNTFLDKYYWKQQEGALGDEMVLINNEIYSLEALLESSKLNKEEDIQGYEEIEAHYGFFRRQYLFNYQERTLAKFYSPDRAIEAVEIALKRDKHILGGLEVGYNFLGQTQAQVKQRIAYNEYILAEGLTPPNSPHEMTAANFLLQLTDYPWMLILLVAIALLNIDLFSGDMEGGAYKHLYSQPIRRSRIYWAKYLVRFFYSFLLVTGLTALAFGAIALKNGIGNLAYPVYYCGGSYHLLSAAAGSLTFLPWSQFMLRTLPLYALLSLFVTVLIGTASLLLQNTGNALNASFCILVLDFLGRTLFPANSKFYLFWPLTVSGINQVLKGVYRASAASYLLLLTLATALFFFGGQTVLRKQDLVEGVGL